MSYSMLAGIGPFGTPELIILGILFVVPLTVIAVVIGVVVYCTRKGKPEAGKVEPPLPPEGN